MSEAPPNSLTKKKKIEFKQIKRQGGKCAGCGPVPAPKKNLLQPRSPLCTQRISDICVSGRISPDLGANGVFGACRRCPPSGAAAAETRGCPLQIKLKEIFETPSEIALVLELVTGGELFDR